MMRRSFRALKGIGDIKFTGVSLGDATVYESYITYPAADINKVCEIIRSQSNH